MYVNQFIEKMEAGERVKLDDQYSYLGVKVNDNITVVYVVGESVLHPDYIGFINHMRNRYYVDDKHVCAEAFHFDDFSNGWSFDMNGCDYMDKVVSGEECSSFKGDSAIKRMVLQRYYTEMCDVIKEVVGEIKADVDMDCKSRYWFRDIPSCALLTESGKGMESLKLTEQWLGIEVDWHNLAFGLSVDDNYIKQFVQDRLENIDDNYLDEYISSYVRACTEYRAVESLFIEPDSRENLYYWLCFDIQEAISDVDSATVKMVDGKEFKLKNIVYDVSNTSYIGGDCGKRYQFCPFINIASIEVGSKRVYDRAKSEQRLSDDKFKNALIDMKCKQGCKLGDIKRGDLIFTEGHFGTVISDNQILCDDKKCRIYKKDNSVLCDVTLESLNDMREMIGFKEEKENGRER